MNFPLDSPKKPVNMPITLATIILMDFLAGMEFDLFVPSFPELQSQFSLSPFWVEALLSINFIGYCLSLVFVGSLADRYGRKPIIMGGLALFILGSVLCLEASVYSSLLVGRFLQGIGIAAPAILSFLIIADAYPLKQQQALMGLLNGIMNLSIGAAPIIGSYITLAFHWQGNFTALLLLGLVTCGMTLAFIPMYKKAEPQESHPHQSYTALFRSKPLRLLLAHIIFQIVPYWIFVGMSPLLYMEDLGVPLLHFGYYQGSLACVFAIGSLLFGRIVNTYNQRRMLIVSNWIFIAGFISMALVTLFDSASPALITLALLLFIIGQIIPTTILYPVCLNLIPQAKGRVSALIHGGRLILSSVSLQVAGYFYQGSFQRIGIILLGFIFLTILTLAFVIKNRDLPLHDVPL